MNRLHLFALVVAIIFVSSSVFTQTKNFKNAVKKLDKDHNGVISLVEFSSRSLKMFRWLDQDSDGIITKQEMDSKESLKKDRLLSKWADQLDRNDDKKIDKGEFILGANNKLKGKRNSRKKGPLGGTSEGKKEVNEAIFKAADGNKDGILDQKELKSEASLERIPKVLVNCSDEDREKNLALVEFLEDLDDVDSVYHNIDMP